jgi:dTDP-4-dehydrorhamnose reductase
MSLSKDKYLVLGDGFLGQAFKREGYNVASIRDIKDPAFISGYKQAEVIVNCVAFTDTRKGKDVKNWKEVFEINSIFPCTLFHRLKEDGKKLIHISTGCVYGYNESLPSETDYCRPMDLYAHSKLIADEYLKKENVLILRPRLLYGTFSHPKNLFNRLAKFSSFFDKINSVTSVEQIVHTVPLLITETGIFNIDSDILSMHEIAEIMGLNPIKNEAVLCNFPNILMAVGKLCRKIGFPDDKHQFSVEKSWTLYKNSVIQ